MFSHSQKIILFFFQKKFLLKCKLLKYFFGVTENNGAILLWTCSQYS
jgi:hypothetical protein